MKKINLLIIIVLIINYSFCQEEKQYNVATIGFYNIENLFDTINDPNIALNHEFSPESEKHWNTEKYFSKIDRIGNVISQIGADVTGSAPAIMGISEVENISVLKDLVKAKDIKEYNYQIIHFDGPDFRGIDCALIYRPDYFKPTNTKRYRVTTDNPKFTTREQLLVSGEIDGEEIHIIVVHWPSRRGGEKRSAPVRAAAADVTRSIVDSILNTDENAKIICMGDLNDDPVNASVKKHLKAIGKKEEVKKGNQFLYNPMLKLYKKGIGSLAYRDNWNLFDQIIISKGFLNKEQKGYMYYKAMIFNKPFLMQKEGKFKGYPLRTYVGSTYMSGYSDHFPVYMFVIKEK